MFREMSDGKDEKFSESFHAPQARLLVVDDTQMNLSVVKGLLKPTRVQVDTAGSGKEALAMLERESYDLMLIDYRMPQMDGVELLHHIRELDGNLNQLVPCIVLTANAISGARDEYLAAGFDDYLAKPINGQLLDQMVARYLPQDKIIYAGMDGFSEEVDVADTTNQEVEAELRAVLGNAKMFNVDKALEYCEEPEILRDALEEFYLAISSKADDIERFAKEKDYRNFTILVHALKSSARLIGVDQLSSYASVLEECGNNEREDKIHDLTPELLRQYRELEPILAPLFTSKDEDLPDISDEELAEAWGDLRELLEVYDYTNADRIMQMLKGYRIPADAKAKYERVRELMAAVDRDQLLELL
jgi:CheY-like chemotaxis protein/HPt (histidine-containing phosphotransfer) domain-containing protein